MATITLTTGATYRGIIVVEHSLPIIIAGGGVQAIKSVLKAAGFADDVGVWLPGDPMPDDWPGGRRAGPCQNLVLGVCMDPTTDVMFEGKWTKAPAPVPASGDGWHLRYPEDVWLHRNADGALALPPTPTPGTPGTVTPEPPQPSTPGTTPAQPPPGPATKYGGPSDPVATKTQEGMSWYAWVGIIGGAFVMGAIIMAGGDNRGKQ